MPGDRSTNTLVRIVAQQWLRQARAIVQERRYKFNNEKKGEVIGEVEAVESTTEAEEYSGEEDEHSDDIIESRFVRAVADYVSDDVTELSFQVGDIILVLDVRESGWWKGRLLTSGGEDGQVAVDESKTQLAIAAGMVINGNSSLKQIPSSSIVESGEVDVSNFDSKVVNIEGDQEEGIGSGARCDASWHIKCPEGRKGNRESSFLNEEILPGMTNETDSASNIGNVGFFPCTFVEYCPFQAQF